MSTGSLATIAEVLCSNFHRGPFRVVVIIGTLNPYHRQASMPCTVSVRHLVEKRTQIEEANAQDIADADVAVTGMHQTLNPKPFQGLFRAGGEEGEACNGPTRVIEGFSEWGWTHMLGRV